MGALTLLLQLHRRAARYWQRPATADHTQIERVTCAAAQPPQQQLLLQLLLQIDLFMQRSAQQLLPVVPQ